MADQLAANDVGSPLTQAQRGWGSTRQRHALADRLAANDPPQDMVQAGRRALRGWDSTGQRLALADTLFANDPLAQAQMGYKEETRPSGLIESVRRRAEDQASAADDIRRQRAAADAEYKERAAAREQQEVEDKIARAGEYTDARQGQIDQLQREIARSEAAESMFKSEAETQRDRNERARTMMNLSPAQQASVIANQDYDRQHGRRLAALQGLGQRRAAEAAAGQAPSVTPEQEQENLQRWALQGESHPNRVMDTRIKQFGPGRVDITGQMPNLEDLQRRGDYLNISPQGELQSIFSPSQRQEIKEERDIKHGLKRRVTEADAAKDPSLTAGSIIDTDYAKSIDRQRVLGQRTGRLTEQARSILASAGISTAGLRGRNKIAEAWEKYDEKTAAKGKEKGKESIFQPGITAASQVLNRMKEGKGATEAEQAVFNTLSNMGIAADSSAEDIMNTIHDRADGHFDFDEQVAVIQHIQNNLTADKKRKRSDVAWSRGDVGWFGSGELSKPQQEAIKSAEGVDTSDPEAVGEWFSRARKSQFAKEEKPQKPKSEGSWWDQFTDWMVEHTGAPQTGAGPIPTGY